MPVEKDVIVSEQTKETLNTKDDKEIIVQDVNGSCDKSKNQLKKVRRDSKLSAAKIRIKKKSDGSASFLRAARAGNLEKVLEFLKNDTDINTCNANGLNALHLASKEGHANVVSLLLERKANVDAATKKGNTALHIASLAGQEEIVKILVENNASVNVQSQNGFTPLYMAAQENHDVVVKFLLANGANQSLATEDGFTPLAVALQQGHDRVVSVLLENDTRGKVRLPALHIAAKKDDAKAAALLLHTDHNPDITSKSGFTPLHIASHYGNDNIAALLIQRGADVNYMAKHQITPLHVASKWGKGNMVSLLVEKNASIDAKTRDGLTPLHCAARSGHETVVDLLLEKGAPLTAKTKNGLAPLHMSSQGDHVDAARILLYHKAPVDDVTVDFLTALHVAAHCGHVGVAKLLLDRKADANARALNGFTPLHIACKKNRIKVVELLLKHGASIEATTESGLTPLHVASFMGCMNIVIYLIQHGASADVPTIRGESPLHLAARANQTDIIRILLRNGAEVDAKAREQQTALHIASRLGNVDIVSLLLQQGASVDAATKDHYTPLHIATKEGQDEVAAILLEHGASLASTTKKGFTPLHLAAKYGHLKVVKLLLQKDAPVDPKGKNGVTPLHVAAHYDHQNVALLLLDKGAQAQATAKNGYTPLHIAARKNQMDIANTLLEFGANANSESKAGFTPLHLSAQEGHKDMANLLVEHGAEPGGAAKNGLTALHLCAQEDKVPVAAVLVKHGAVIDPQTKAGYSPLHVAAHFGQLNMVKFLIQHGAKIDEPTELGYTALHQAAQQGHTKIVNLLLDNQAKADMETKDGKTALSIAQRLGYISVMETLKIVTETTITTNTTSTTEEKYKVVVPETMHETFMSESEDELDDVTQCNGHAAHVNLPSYEGQFKYTRDDTVLGDQSYRYLTVDEMKSLGDDSLPIDVTKDEKLDISFHGGVSHDRISPQHRKEFYGQPDNIELSKPPVLAGTESLNTTLNTTMDTTFHDDIMNDSRAEKQQKIKKKWPKKEGIAEDSKEIVEKDSGVQVPTPWEELDVPLFLNETDASIEFSFESGRGASTPNIQRMSIDEIVPCLTSRARQQPMRRRRFLVSFMVDARGGAMRGCRHSGVRVIIPPRKAAMPTRITCRYLKKDKLVHVPPLMEGEALASRILEMGPSNSKFLGPVIIEVPHFASLRGKEREIVILRSDNGETWREHTLEATEDAVQEVLNESFDGEELKQLEDLNTSRITRILTTDFPQYFAIVTRIRQEVHAIGPEGGMVSSTVVPQVQAVFPQGSLTKKIKVGLQAQPICSDLVSKLLGNRVAVSPIVTVEPRRRKFHKPITLTIPVPQAASKGMINQYSGEAPTLRLLCSITGVFRKRSLKGGTTRAQWEDVTGSTPLTFVNDCVSFTTTVSARFWLMDATNIAECTKMATELYREAIHVPFMSKFLVFSKRHQVEEARVRVFCMTDDREDKTLEAQESFREVAKSRDVEVLEGKPQYLEFGGNLLAVTKSGDQLGFNFYAFRENRLPFTVRVKDPSAEPAGRLAFMRQPKVGRGDVPQNPICTLNFTLPEEIRPEPAPSEPDLTALEKKYAFLSISKSAAIHKADLRLSDISNLLTTDWVRLAKELDVSDSDINIIKSEYPDNIPQQAIVMLRLWMQNSGNKATGNTLEKGLRAIGRDDIVQSCIQNVEIVTDVSEKARASQYLESDDERHSREIIYDDDRDIMKDAESAEEEEETPKIIPVSNGTDEIHETEIVSEVLASKYESPKVYNQELEVDSIEPTRLDTEAQSSYAGINVLNSSQLEYSGFIDNTLSTTIDSSANGTHLEQTITSHEEPKLNTTMTPFSHTEELKERISESSSSSSDQGISLPTTQIAKKVSESSSEQEIPLPTAQKEKKVSESSSSLSEQEIPPPTTQKEKSVSESSSSSSSDQIIPSPTTHKEKKVSESSSSSSDEEIPSPTIQGEKKGELDFGGEVIANLGAVETFVEETITHDVYAEDKVVQQEDGEYERTADEHLPQIDESFNIHEEIEVRESKLSELDDTKKETRVRFIEPEKSSSSYSPSSESDVELEGQYKDHEEKFETVEDHKLLLGSEQEKLERLGIDDLVHDDKYEEETEQKATEHMLATPGVEKFEVNTDRVEIKDSFSEYPETEISLDDEMIEIIEDDSNKLEHVQESQIDSLNKDNLTWSEPAVCDIMNSGTQSTEEPSLESDYGKSSDLELENITVIEQKEAQQETRSLDSLSYQQESTQSDDLIPLDHSELQISIDSLRAEPGELSTELLSPEIKEQLQEDISYTEASRGLEEVHGTKVVPEMQAPKYESSQSSSQEPEDALESVSSKLLPDSNEHEITTTVDSLTNVQESSEFSCEEPKIDRTVTTIPDIQNEELKHDSVDQVIHTCTSITEVEKIKEAAKTSSSPSSSENKSEPQTPGKAGEEYLKSITDEKLSLTGETDKDKCLESKDMKNDFVNDNKDVTEILEKTIEHVTEAVEESTECLTEVEQKEAQLEIKSFDSTSYREPVQSDGLIAVDHSELHLSVNSLEDVPDEISTRSISPEIKDQPEEVFNKEVSDFEEIHGTKILSEAPVPEYESSQLCSQHPEVLEVPPSNVLLDSSQYEISITSETLNKEQEDTHFSCEESKKEGANISFTPSIQAKESKHDSFDPTLSSSSMQVHSEELEVDSIEPTRLDTEADINVLNSSQLEYSGIVDNTLSTTIDSSANGTHLEQTITYHEEPKLDTTMTPLSHTEELKERISESLSSSSSDQGISLPTTQKAKKVSESSSSSSSEEEIILPTAQKEKKLSESSSSLSPPTTQKEKSVSASSSSNQNILSPTTHKGKKVSKSLSSSSDEDIPSPTIQGKKKGELDFGGEVIANLGAVETFVEETITHDVYAEDKVVQQEDGEYERTADEHLPQIDESFNIHEEIEIRESKFSELDDTKKETRVRFIEPEKSSSSSSSSSESDVDLEGQYKDHEKKFETVEDHKLLLGSEQEKLERLLIDDLVHDDKYEVETVQKTTEHAIATPSVEKYEVSTDKVEIKDSFSDYPEMEISLDDEMIEVIEDDLNKHEHVQDAVQELQIDSLNKDNLTWSEPTVCDIINSGTQSTKESSLESDHEKSSDLELENVTVIEQKEAQQETRSLDLLSYQQESTQSDDLIPLDHSEWQISIDSLRAEPGELSTKLLSSEIKEQLQKNIPFTEASRGLKEVHGTKVVPEIQAPKYESSQSSSQEPEEALEYVSSKLLPGSNEQEITTTVDSLTNVQEGIAFSCEEPKIDRTVTSIPDIHNEELEHDSVDQGIHTCTSIAEVEKIKEGAKTSYSSSSSENGSEPETPGKAGEEYLKSVTDEKLILASETDKDKCLESKDRKNNDFVNDNKDVTEILEKTIEHVTEAVEESTESLTVVEQKEDQLEIKSFDSTTYHGEPVQSDGLFASDHSELPISVNSLEDIHEISTRSISPEINNQLAEEDEEVSGLEEIPGAKILSEAPVPKYESSQLCSQDPEVFEVPPSKLLLDSSQYKISITSETLNKEQEDTHFSCEDSKKEGANVSFTPSIQAKESKHDSFDPTLSSSSTQDIPTSTSVTEEEEREYVFEIKANSNLEPVVETSFAQEEKSLENVLVENKTWHQRDTGCDRAVNDNLPQSGDEFTDIVEETKIRESGFNVIVEDARTESPMRSSELETKSLSSSSSSESNLELIAYENNSEEHLKTIKDKKLPLASKEYMDKSLKTKDIEDDLIDDDRDVAETKVANEETIEHVIVLAGERSKFSTLYTDKLEAKESSEPSKIEVNLDEHMADVKHGLEHLEFDQDVVKSQVDSVNNDNLKTSIEPVICEVACSSTKSTKDSSLDSNHKNADLALESEIITAIEQKKAQQETRYFDVSHHQKLVQSDDLIASDHSELAPSIISLEVEHDEIFTRPISPEIKDEFREYFSHTKVSSGLEEVETKKVSETQAPKYESSQLCSQDPEILAVAPSKLLFDSNQYEISITSESLNKEQEDTHFSCEESKNEDTNISFTPSIQAEELKNDSFNPTLLSSSTQDIPTSTSITEALEKEHVSEIKAKTDLEPAVENSFVQEEKSHENVFVENKAWHQKTACGDNLLQDGDEITDIVEETKIRKSELNVLVDGTKTETPIRTSEPETKPSLSSSSSESNLELKAHENNSEEHLKTLEDQNLPMASEENKEKSLETKDIEDNFIDEEDAAKIKVTNIEAIELVVVETAERSELSTLNTDKLERKESSESPKIEVNLDEHMTDVKYGLNCILIERDQDAVESHIESDKNDLTTSIKPVCEVTHSDTKSTEEPSLDSNYKKATDLGLESENFTVIEQKKAQEETRNFDVSQHQKSVQADDLMTLEHSEFVLSMNSLEFEPDELSTKSISPKITDQLQEDIPNTKVSSGLEDVEIKKSSETQVSKYELSQLCSQDPKVLEVMSSKASFDSNQDESSTTGEILTNERESSRFSCEESKIGATILSTPHFETEDLKDDSLDSTSSSSDQDILTSTDIAEVDVESKTKFNLEAVEIQLLKEEKVYAENQMLPEKGRDLENAIDNDLLQSDAELLETVKKIRDSELNILDDTSTESQVRVSESDKKLSSSESDSKLETHGTDREEHLKTSTDLNFLLTRENENVKRFEQDIEADFVDDKDAATTSEKIFEHVVVVQDEEKAEFPTFIANNLELSDSSSEFPKSEVTLEQFTDAVKPEFKIDYDKDTDESRIDLVIKDMSSKSEVTCSGNKSTEDPILDSGYGKETDLKVLYPESIGVIEQKEVQQESKSFDSLLCPQVSTQSDDIISLDHSELHLSINSLEVEPGEISTRSFSPEIEEQHENISNTEVSSGLEEVGTKILSETQTPKYPLSQLCSQEPEVLEVVPLKHSIYSNQYESSTTCDSFNKQDSSHFSCEAPKIDTSISSTPHMQTEESKHDSLASTSSSSDQDVSSITEKKEAASVVKTISNLEPVERSPIQKEILQENFAEDIRHQNDNDFERVVNKNLSKNENVKERELNVVDDIERESLVKFKQCEKKFFSFSSKSDLELETYEENCEELIDRNSSFPRETENLKILESKHVDFVDNDKHMVKAEKLSEYVVQNGEKSKFLTFSSSNEIKDSSDDLKVEMNLDEKIDIKPELNQLERDITAVEAQTDSISKYNLMSSGEQIDVKHEPNQLEPHITAVEAQTDSLKKDNLMSSGEQIDVKHEPNQLERHITAVEAQIDSLKKDNLTSYGEQIDVKHELNQLERDLTAVEAQTDSINKDNLMLSGEQIDVKHEPNQLERHITAVEAHTDSLKKYNLMSSNPVACEATYNVTSSTEKPSLDFDYGKATDLELQPDSLTVMEQREAQQETENFDSTSYHKKLFQSDDLALDNSELHRSIDSLEAEPVKISTGSMFLEMKSQPSEDVSNTEVFNNLNGTKAVSEISETLSPEYEFCDKKPGKVLEVESSKLLMESHQGSTFDVEDHTLQSDPTVFSSDLTCETGLFKDNRESVTADENSVKEDSKKFDELKVDIISKSDHQSEAFNNSDSALSSYSREDLSNFSMSVEENNEKSALEDEVVENLSPVETSFAEKVNVNENGFAECSIKHEQNNEPTEISKEIEIGLNDSNETSKETELRFIERVKSSSLSSSIEDNSEQETHIDTSVKFVEKQKSLQNLEKYHNSSEYKNADNFVCKNNEAETFEQASIQDEEKTELFVGNIAEVKFPYSAFSENEMNLGEQMAEADGDLQNLEKCQDSSSDSISKDNLTWSEPAICDALNGGTSTEVPSLDSYNEKSSEHENIMIEDQNETQLETRIFDSSNGRESLQFDDLVTSVDKFQNEVPSEVIFSESRKQSYEDFSHTQEGLTRTSEADFQMQKESDVEPLIQAESRQPPKPQPGFETLEKESSTAKASSILSLPSQSKNIEENKLDEKKNREEGIGDFQCKNKTEKFKPVSPIPNDRDVIVSIDDDAEEDELLLLVRDSPCWEDEEKLYTVVSEAKPIKATIRLLVKTIDVGKELVEIRSVSEFVDNASNKDENKLKAISSESIDEIRDRSLSPTCGSPVNLKFLKAGEKISPKGNLEKYCLKEQESENFEKYENMDDSLHIRQNTELKTKDKKHFAISSFVSNLDNASFSSTFRSSEQSSFGYSVDSCPLSYYTSEDNAEIENPSTEVSVDEGEFLDDSDVKSRSIDQICEIQMEYDDAVLFTRLQSFEATEDTDVTTPREMKDSKFERDSNNSLLECSDEILEVKEIPKDVEFEVIQIEKGEEEAEICEEKTLLEYVKQIDEIKSELDVVSCEVKAEDKTPGIAGTETVIIKSKLTNICDSLNNIDRQFSDTENFLKKNLIEEVSGLLKSLDEIFEKISIDKEKEQAFKIVSDSIIVEKNSSVDKSEYDKLSGFSELVETCDLDSHKLNEDFEVIATDALESNFVPSTLNNLFDLSSNTNSFVSFRATKNDPEQLTDSDAEGEKSVK